MNAYDLANELDIQSKHTGIMSIGATMIRQQADRIAELEKNFDIAIMVTKKDAELFARVKTDGWDVCGIVKELKDGKD